MISGGFWAFFLTAIPVEARAQQVFVPLGATVFAVLLLGFYPLAWISRRTSVEPRLRAFLEESAWKGPSSRSTRPTG